jgi:hypothetical protein
MQGGLGFFSIFYSLSFYFDLLTTHGVKGLFLLSVMLGLYRTFCVCSLKNVSFEGAKFW